MVLLIEISPIDPYNKLLILNMPTTFSYFVVLQKILRKILKKVTLTAKLNIILDRLSYSN